MSNHFRYALMGLLTLIALVLAFTPTAKLAPEEITAPKLARLIQNKSIVNAEVTPRAYHGIYTVKGAYTRPSQAAPAEFSITTHLSDAQLADLLSRNTARLELPRMSTRAKYLDMIPTVVVLCLVVGLVAYQVNLGKGKGAHMVRARPDVRFRDVAGVEEAKNEVQEVIDFLRDPNKYTRLGGTLPKGILLIGPPGTGKTMLAKAIAGEANASFFSASGSDFTEIYVGVGARRIRELFRRARKSKPAIIFIDEIDCLGKHRKLDQNGELQQTNNALLTAMDGFDTAEGIIVVAATNRPEDLDEALLRPGRFDRKVYVPLPDAKGRRAILESHSRKTPLNAPNQALEVIAQTTPGMSGADLANLINEAAILSALRNKNAISLLELEEARDKVRFGNERKSMVLKPEERRVVAFHEAGHAIIYLQKTLLPPLHKVSIVPRGQALGSTTVLPQEDQNIHGRKFLLEQLAVLMGGRAAEEAFCGDMTNGAHGDLESAKNIARKMVHEWGMGQKLYYEPEKQDAEKEINLLLTRACEEAREIIAAQKVETRKLAEALLVHDTLTRDQVRELLDADQMSEIEGLNSLTAHVS
ncbi:MAG: AAA family ATPase [Verrucomicrobiota bacterium]